MTTLNSEANQITQDELAAVKKLQDSYAAMKRELGKVIVGQSRGDGGTADRAFCRGHCLLVGVPGLAKTLLISTLAKTLSLASTASSSRRT